VSSRLNRLPLEWMTFTQMCYIWVYLQNSDDYMFISCCSLVLGYIHVLQLASLSCFLNTIVHKTSSLFVTFNCGVSRALKIASNYLTGSKLGTSPDHP